MFKTRSLETTTSTSLRQRIVKLARICSIFTAGIASLLVLLRYLCLPILVYICPEVNLFDTGIYGAYPEEHYVSSDLRSPQANVVQWDSSCDDGGLVLMTLDGNSVSNPGPMILDMQGNLVWKSDDFGMTMNAKIQSFQGQDYITFWAGEKLQESGLGKYYMLDSSYSVAYTVSAVGEVEGDLHEFKITPEGSALMTVYNRTQVNFSLHSTDTKLAEDDTLIDGIFQEIDIATGILLFEWSALNHLSAENVAYLGSSHGGYVADGAFDYFHINSVEKDSKRNYLVSLRHLNTIIYVSGSTGEILWAVGGNSDDFEDISYGEATNFSWQHDARWVSEEQGIFSLFDNGMAHKHYDAPYSRGLMLQLDFENWTVELLHEYTSLNRIGAASQGNVQLLESAKHDREAHVFIGWGASAAFSEHTISGELLCETHLGASWLFYFERVKSYRAFKTFGWKGEPAWDPAAQIEGSEVFVSWNGATEVAYWILQGQRQLDGAFEDVDTTPKDEAFESSFTLPEEDFVIYRVAAVDVNDQILGLSNTVTSKPSSNKVGIVSIVVFSIATFVVCYLVYRYKGHFQGGAYHRVNGCGSEGEELEELVAIKRRLGEDRSSWYDGMGEECIHSEPPR